MTPEEAKAKLGPQPASASVQGDAKVAKTVFHNQYPGSSFVMPDGSVLGFDYKGELETDDPRVVKELEAIADKPGSPVFYKKNAATPAPGDKQAVQDNLKNAENVVAALAKQQGRVA